MYVPLKFDEKITNDTESDDSSKNMYQKKKCGSKVNFIYNMNKQDTYKKSTSYMGT